MKGSIISIGILSFILAGCSPLMLTQGDFAWPVESVLKVDNKGTVEDKQYYFSFNVKDLLFTETQDSVNISDVTLRIIRAKNGYFFITASKFKNIYVFEQAESGLKLRNTILISKDGIENPALNQRPPFIQLLNEPNPPVLLTKDGIFEGEDK
jgi:hypothetical protein